MVIQRLWYSTIRRGILCNLFVQMEFCLVQFVMEIKDAMEGILFEHECKKRNEGFRPNK